MLPDSAFDGLTDEEKRRLLETYAPAMPSLGPVGRGAAAFSPVTPRAAANALMPDRQPPAPAGVEDDLMRRFAEAQDRGAGNAAFRTLGSRLDNFARVYAGLPEKGDDGAEAVRRTPVQDFLQRQSLANQQRSATRQGELDSINLAKTKAETERAQASARATSEEAAREAALARVDSPETEAQRKSTAALLAKNPNVTPALLASLNGLQLRELAKTGTSQINAEVMADYRNRALIQQDENADAARAMQAYALRQGWDIANLTLEQRERMAKMEAELKAEKDAKEGVNRVTDQESKLRSEILNLAPIKEYQLAAIGLDKVRNAAQSIRAAIGAAKEPTPADDIALIFGYMKTIDPTSVVRETEFATAQNAAGVPDRIRNMWNSVKSGNRLNNDQRKEFIASAESQFQAYENRANGLLSGYRDYATRSGLNPDNIILGGLLAGQPQRVPMQGGELGSAPGMKSSLMPNAQPAVAPPTPMPAPVPESPPTAQDVAIPTSVAPAAPTASPPVKRRIIRPPAVIPPVEKDPLRRNRVIGSGTETDPYIISVAGQKSGYLQSFLSDGEVAYLRDLDGGRVVEKVGGKIRYADGKPPPRFKKAEGK